MKRRDLSGYYSRLRSALLRGLGALLLATSALSMSSGCGDDLPSLEIPAGLPENQRIEKVDQWLNQLQKDKLFNGAVMISRNSVPLLAKGYGFADPAQQIPLTPDSSFRLASVSKNFTGVAIMMLVKSGALSYEDPVTKYIPELPYAGVTIRHLLNQSSGIPDEYLNLAAKHRAGIQVLTNEKAVSLLVQEKLPAKAAPNASFEYSNTNYIILARVVEIVSGQSFEEFLQSKVFDPLKMTHTRVWNLVSKNQEFPGKVASMAREEGELKALSPNFVDGVSGDGGVFSSLSDLLIWGRFWHSDELLTLQEKRLAMTPAKLNDGSLVEYGFGWSVDEETIWHNGGWLGARTFVVMDVQAKIMLVVLDNSSSEHIDKITQEILTSGVLN